MSFLLDPPLLFVSGTIVYVAGNRRKMKRLAKITLGSIIVLYFILFGLLFYTDVFRCIFLFICSNMSGSEFMFHSNITGIYKKDIPLLVIILLFALYPFWIYFGYASAMILGKSRRFSKEVYSYNDVKSRKGIFKTKYSVVRYPDIHLDMNEANHAVRAAIDSLGWMLIFLKGGNISKGSMDKERDTKENIKRKKINLAMFIIFSILFIFGFASGGYLAKSSFEFVLGVTSALILAAWFTARMKTKHLVAVYLSSVLVSYVVERHTVLAGMWRYFDNAAPPLFAIFAVPVFVIVIIGFAQVLRRVFAYVGLTDPVLNNVPFALVLLAFGAFLYFEGYLRIASPDVIAVYTGLAVLGIFYTSKQTLDWNLAFASASVALGGLMELLGAASGLWSYAFGEGMPVFISFAWAMNAWGVCGIAQLCGINIRDAVIE